MTWSFHPAVQPPVLSVVNQSDSDNPCTWEHHSEQERKQAAMGSICEWKRGVLHARTGAQEAWFPALKSIPRPAIVHRSSRRGGEGFAILKT